MGLKIKIKENALLARLAARILKSEQMAITLGCTIYLWRTPTAVFLAQPRWVRHELAHVAQFLRYGRGLFVLWYLWESLRKGYHDNRFEQEARAAEHQDSILLSYL